MSFKDFGHGPEFSHVAVLPQADLPKNMLVVSFVSWGNMWMWEVTSSSDFSDKRGCEFQHTFNEAGEDVIVHYETWN